MDEPGFEGGFLGASRVAIWGLGLMGGSLALALRGKCAGLVGVDVDPGTVALAREMGVVDAASTRPEDALGGADVIILATPVRTILTLLDQLPDLCQQNAVVIDLGSTKARIMEKMAGLPDRFDPLGAHPMCGKEKSSLAHAEASIYHNAPFALVALERTSQRARALGEELAKAAGSCPLWIEADQHDRWVAATSHAPFLVASALALATPPEVAPLIGSGFRSTARVGASPARMMIDILATNGENIREAIRRVQDGLAQYESLLAAEDYEALARLFEQAGENYRGLVQ